MPGRIGRQVKFLFGGNSPGDEIPGIREKGVEFSGEPIDVTSDENNGVRTLLDNASVEDQVGVNVSGVTKDTRLKEAWVNNQRTQNITFEYPDGAILSGTFFMSSYNEGEPYNEASTFDATFMSSGTVTFTPAS